MSGLPTGWASAAISDIATVNPPSGELISPDAEVSFVPMAAVEAQSGRIDTSISRSFGELRRKSFRAFEEGDVLFAKITPCMENGKAAVARNLKLQRGFGSTEFHVLRSHSGINPDFLLHFLLQKQFRDTAARNMKGTAGQLRVPTSYLAEHQIPIPPTAEQDRIVAAIEEQFSRLDAGVATLESALEKLRLMRAVVLQAAVTGHLATADSSEGADGLPVGWELLSPDEIAASKRHALAIGPFGSNLKVSDYTLQGVPLVFVRQVRRGVFGGAGTRYISAEKADELSAHRVQSGDVLVTKMGEPPGDAAVYPASQPDAVITADVIKLSVREGILPEYVAMAINSKLVRDQFISITRGVAQQKVSLARFRQSVRIPIPPAGDQDMIVKKASGWIQEIDRVDVSIRMELARAASLRSSILASAFSGKLVPQDPTDEPASVLLERLAAERASSNGQRSKRGRSSRVLQGEVTV
jgi:type I restriction enzyme S subunit